MYYVGILIMVVNKDPQYRDLIIVPVNMLGIGYRLNYVINSFINIILVNLS